MGMHSPFYPTLRNMCSFTVKYPVRQELGLRDFQVFRELQVLDLVCKSDPEAKVIPKIRQTGPLIVLQEADVLLLYLILY